MESATSCADLDFNGDANANFEKTSITVSKYLLSLLTSAYGCISTRSACQRSSIPVVNTDLLLKCFLAGL